MTGCTRWSALLLRAAMGRPPLLGSTRSATDPYELFVESMRLNGTRSTYRYPCYWAAFEPTTPAGALSSAAAVITEQPLVYLIVRNPYERLLDAYLSRLEHLRAGRDPYGSLPLSLVQAVPANLSAAAAPHAFGAFAAALARVPSAQLAQLSTFAAHHLLPITSSCLRCGRVHAFAAASFGLARTVVLKHEHLDEWYGSLVAALGLQVEHNGGCRNEPRQVATVSVHNALGLAC